MAVRVCDRREEDLEEEELRGLRGQEFVAELVLFHTAAGRQQYLEVIQEGVFVCLLQPQCNFLFDNASSKLICVNQNWIATAMFLFVFRPQAVTQH